MPANAEPTLGAGLIRIVHRLLKLLHAPLQSLYLQKQQKQFGFRCHTKTNSKQVYFPTLQTAARATGSGFTDKHAPHPRLQHWKYGYRCALESHGVAAHYWARPAHSPPFDAAFWECRGRRQRPRLLLELRTAVAHTHSVCFQFLSFFSSQFSVLSAPVS